MQEYIDDIELEDWLLDYEYNELKKNDFCSLILNNLGMIVGATIGGGILGFVLGFIRFITHAGASTVLFNNIKLTAGIFAGLGFLLSVLFFYMLSSKEDLDVSFEEIGDEEFEEDFLDEEYLDSEVLVVDSTEFSDIDEDIEEIEEYEDDENNKYEYEVSMLTLWGKVNNKAISIQPAFNAFLCYIVINILFVISVVLLAAMNGIGIYMLMCAIDWLFNREIWWMGNALIVFVYEFLYVLLYDTMWLDKKTWDYIFNGAAYEKEILPPPTLLEKLFLITFSVIFATFVLSFI